MKNKAVFAGAILLLAILSLIFVYSVDDAGNSDNKTELTVYSEGPVDLVSIVSDIKTADYYNGHDNETLAWMESLGNKKVFSGNGTFVVMDSGDADKLRSQYVDDAYIEEFIECNVLENHSLGDIKCPKDVLLVKDVRYLGEEIHSLQ